MDARRDTIKRQRLTLSGADGNTLCADLFIPPCIVHGLVVLVHGGGQTRHSWGGTARTLAGRGWIALAYDQRGHGDSDWIADAAYGSEHYARDLIAVARQMAEYGFGTVVAGASLGGIATTLKSTPMTASA